MKIALTVGHSRLKNGSYTSADGRGLGGCNEYKWCKAWSKQVKTELEAMGHTVKRIVCPEKKFTSSTQEKSYKLNLIKAGNYDLVIELHLNAASASANGVEVLYKASAGKRYAVKVQKQLSTVFRDRGTKQRDNLYILNQTKPPAILIEAFFCTNSGDYKKGKGLKNRTKLARLVAAGIGKA